MHRAVSYLQGLQTMCKFQSCRVECNLHYVCKHSLHPTMRKNHHFLERLLNTTTNKR